MFWYLPPKAGGHCCCEKTFKEPFGQYLGLNGSAAVLMEYWQPTGDSHNYARKLQEFPPKVQNMYIKVHFEKARHLLTLHK